MPRTRNADTRRKEAIRLRQLRRVMGLSQRELADEFLVGASTIALWETGSRTMPGPALRLLELFEEELHMEHGDEHEGLRGLSTSRWGRSTKLTLGLLSGATSLAGTGLGGLLSFDGNGGSLRHTTQVAVARRIAGTLGELKGLSMKIGQMVSYLDFALPAEAREALQGLQAQSPPMAYDVVVDVFLEEFGQTPAQLFAEFEPQAFAAASIGQVHRARLHSGEQVAVKVQYPGIGQAISSDLRNAALLDRLFTLIYPNQDRGAITEELKARLLEECDYEQEARNQQEFAHLLRDEVDVVVPRVYDELSTRHVLVSEYIDGEPFAAFCERATQDERDQVGAVLFRTAWTCILDHHVFNADPHPGNYLIADGKVVLLDFGCVKRYPPEFIALWRRLMCATLEDDRDAVLAALHDFDVIRDARRFNYDYHRSMMLAIYAPLLRDARFRFSADYLTGTWRAMFPDNPNKASMNMPRDWLFNNRIQWGLFAVLAMLGAENDYRDMILDLLYPPGATRPAPIEAA